MTSCIITLYIHEEIYNLSQKVLEKSNGLSKVTFFPKSVIVTKMNVLTFEIITT